MHYWHRITGLRSHRSPFFGIGGNYIGGSLSGYDYVEGDRINGVRRPYGAKDIFLDIYSPKRAKGFYINLNDAPSQIKSQYAKRGEEEIKRQVAAITIDQINEEARRIAHQAELDAKAARNFQLTWYQKLWKGYQEGKKKIELTVAEWTGLKDEFKKKTEKFAQATETLKSMNLPSNHPLWKQQHEIANQQLEIARKVKESGQDGLGADPVTIAIGVGGVIVLGIGITYMILSYLESTDIFTQAVEAAKALCNELPSDKRAVCLEKVAKDVRDRMPLPGTGKGLFDWLLGTGSGKYLAVGGVGVLGLLVYLKARGKWKT